LPAFARAGQRHDTLKRVAQRGRCRLLFLFGVKPETNTPSDERRHSESNTEKGRLSWWPPLYFTVGGPGSHCRCCGGIRACGAHTRLHSRTWHTPGRHLTPPPFSTYTHARHTHADSTQQELLTLKPQYGFPYSPAASTLPASFPSPLASLAGTPPCCRR
jgi:hypothetical protein